MSVITLNNFTIYRC